MLGGRGIQRAGPPPQTVSPIMGGRERVPSVPVARWERLPSKLWPVGGSPWSKERLTVITSTKGKNTYLPMLGRLPDQTKSGLLTSTKGRGTIGHCEASIMPFATGSPAF
jgi:hypothetical protein